MSPFEAICEAQCPRTRFEEFVHELGRSPCKKKMRPFDGTPKRTPIPEQHLSAAPTTCDSKEIASCQSACLSQALIADPKVTTEGRRPTATSLGQPMSGCSDPIRGLYGWAICRMTMTSKDALSIFWGLGAQLWIFGFWLLLTTTLPPYLL